MRHSPCPEAAGSDLLVKPGFAGVVLFCGECEKRGLVQAAFRLRCVRCSCLGLCPRKAIAVTVAAPGHPLVAVEVRSGREAAVLSATIAASRRK